MHLRAALLPQVRGKLREMQVVLETLSDLRIFFRDYFPQKFNSEEDVSLSRKSPVAAEGSPFPPGTTGAVLPPSPLGA